jgi:hypothetical protein
MSKTKHPSLDLARRMLNGTDPLLRDYALEVYPKLSKTPFEINSFEEVCYQMGKDPSRYEIESTEEPEFVFLKQVERIMLICKFYRKGQKMDPNNTDQKKWWPIWDLQISSDNPSGFLFFYSYFTDTTTDSVLGPLLWLQDKETCDYVAKTFESEFKKAIILNQ